ncbi:MAG: hypothetical protein Q8O62_04440 [Aequorivita sp.]|nr:hypothetical protein [Aequorivita sp.]
MAVIINTGADSISFTLNGTSFPRIYQCLKQGLNHVAIYNVYDTNLQILGSTRYNEFIIDGDTYGSQSAVIEALLPIILASQAGGAVIIGGGSGKAAERIIPFIASGSTELAQVAYSVNHASPIIVPKNTTQIISFIEPYGNGNSLVDTSSTPYFKKRQYILKKGQGTYGLTGLVTNPVDYIILTPNIIGRNEATTFDLGYIGGQEISAYVNLHGPYLIIGTTIFETTEGSFVFSGDDGLYGLNETQTTPENFIEMGVGNGSNRWEKIHNLSLSGITTTGVDELTYVANAVVEHGPFTCEPDQQMIMRITTPFGEGVIDRYYAVLPRVTTIGGSASDTIVVPSYFRPDGQSITSEIPSNIIIELGDIDTGPVEDYFNLGDSGSTWNMSVKRFIRATLDDDVTLWSWQGLDGEYGGTGTTATTSDFFLITGSFSGQSSPFITVGTGEPNLDESIDAYRTGKIGLGEPEPLEFLDIVGTQVGGTGGFKMDYTWTAGEISRVQLGGQNLLSELGVPAGVVKGNLLDYYGTGTRAGFRAYSANGNFGAVNSFLSDFAFSAGISNLAGTSYSNFNAVPGSTGGYNLSSRTLNLTSDLSSVDIRQYGLGAGLDLEPEIKNTVLNSEGDYAFVRITPHYVESTNLQKLPDYGDGTFVSGYTHTDTSGKTGTVATTIGAATYGLAVDTNGNLMEVALGGSDVTKVGAPADNQVAVWTGNGTVEGTSKLLWDDTNSVLELNGNLFQIKLKENLNNKFVTIGNEDFGSGALRFKNQDGKTLMIIANPSLTNSHGKLAIGNVSSIPTESQLYVYGGENGANIDMRGSAIADEANIDWEGNDWTKDPNSIGVSYFGSSYSGGGTIMGYPKLKTGVLRWGQADYALIVTNNASGVVPIRFGINDVEIVRIDDEGLSYASDFSAENAANDRWIPDKKYVDSNRLLGYTITTLPASPTIGDMCYVTNGTDSAVNPGTAVGGTGSTVRRVFYNGTIWTY